LERAHVPPDDAVRAHLCSSRSGRRTTAVQRTAAHRAHGAGNLCGTDVGLTALATRVHAAPLFEHPNRSYLLARAPVSAVAELSRFPLNITPSLAWPDDHAWCVATEIDFDSTVVAASAECAAALLADDRMEALPVHPDDRLDIGGDVLNS
jgi:hypothetical protein